MKKRIFGMLLMGAMVIASVSMFTSCKDYDDDINKLQSQIDAAALKAELESLRTSLATDLANAKSALETAIAAKANASDLEGLAKKSDLDGLAKESDLEDLAKKSDLDGLAKESDLTDLAATVANLSSQLAQVENALKNAEDDVKGMATTLATLTGDMKDLEKAFGEEKAARLAVEKSLEGQKDALDELKKIVEELAAKPGITYDDTAVKDDIKKLQDEVKALQNANYATKSELSAAIDKLDKALSAKIPNIDVLKVFVNRALNSISLVPQLFVGGIEAIEFNSIQYTEVAKGTSGKQYKAGATATLIDNGTAEAYYRLNPAIVERNSIDESNMEFLAATAKTRNATVKSPVDFNGIEAWNYNGKKGLIKVNLKKNITTSLNNPPSDNIYIVALKVPRKADAAKGIEAADIVSENSRLVENVITPKIARLPWRVTETLKDGNNNNSNIHHYSDSAVVWQSKVDNTPLQMVYAEVNYNQTYNLLEHVTGCKQTTDVIVAAHTNQATDEITKAKLKTYGLTFRFAVAGKAANVAYGAPRPNDVDHYTNQQKFAKVDPVKGIISSVLPDGVTDNRAFVGKELIIRIMLVDTVNNKLVDERYMKIKWVEQIKAPVTLETFKTETTLKPCATNYSDGITWEWFITQVYAKADAIGLSQQTFEAVYGTRTPSLESVTPNYNSVAGVDVLSPVAAVALPIVQTTTNERGDALIANWQLEPQEIARIYPSQTKVFKAKIVFKSSLPTEYPDLILPWEWTIKLPTLPEINGYYDNYWFTKYTLHDVMPVQYNSALYDEIVAGTTVPQGGELETYALANGKYTYTDYKGNQGGYCVYYNNLMNAFTYEQKNNVPQFIVKNLGNDCGTWDMQFTKAGTDRIATGVNYTQYTNYAPKFGTNQSTWSSFKSPDLLKEDWNTGDEFRAYRLYRQPWTTSEKQALQMVWDDGHISWCGNIAHKQAILYADHNNDANQVLINPLSQQNESDGRTPKRTHDKKVHIGIWGTLNDWNVIPVKDYDICLVAPVRINAKLDGAFEEGYVSGTCVSCDDAFTMTDFRGYEVAQTDVPAARQNEWNKFRSQLYKYYEVGEPTWNLNDVRYGMRWTGSDVVADDNATYSNALTSAKIKQYTNENIVLSVERKNWNGVWYLVFKNNGGSNVEEEVNVFIPVTVTYGFGKLTEYAKVRLYPKGKVASGVTIVAYPGNN